MNAYKSYKRRNKKTASAPEPAVLSERPKNENGEKEKIKGNVENEQ